MPLGPCALSQQLRVYLVALGKRHREREKRWINEREGVRERERVREKREERVRENREERVCERERE